MTQQSEVARLMQQIALETSAMQSAMTGFASVARHDAITHRYEAIGQYCDQLASLVGEEQATDLMIEAYSTTMDALPGDLGGKEQKKTHDH
jgi:hypothetical protein